MKTSSASDQNPHTAPVLKPEVSARIRANHNADAAYLRDRYGVDLGLDDVGETGQLIRSPRRVDELLDGLDRDVLIQLQLRIIQANLVHQPVQRTITSRVVSRVSRALRGSESRWRSAATTLPASVVEQRSRSVH